MEGETKKENRKYLGNILRLMSAIHILYILGCRAHSSGTTRVEISVMQAFIQYNEQKDRKSMRSCVNLLLILYIKSNK